MWRSAAIPAPAFKPVTSCEPCQRACLASLGLATMQDLPFFEASANSQREQTIQPPLWCTIRKPIDEHRDFQF